MAETGKPESVTLRPADRLHLRQAAECLQSADYDLGVAARLIEGTCRAKWQREADSLMRKCVKLREAIYADTGWPS